MDSPTVGSLQFSLVGAMNKKIVFSGKSSLNLIFDL